MRLEFARFAPLRLHRPVPSRPASPRRAGSATPAEEQASTEPAPYARPWPPSSQLQALDVRASGLPGRDRPIAGSDPSAIIPPMIYFAMAFLAAFVSLFVWLASKAFRTRIA